MLDMLKHARHIRKCKCLNVINVLLISMLILMFDVDIDVRFSMLMLMLMLILPNNTRSFAVVVFPVSRRFLPPTQLEDSDRFSFSGGQP